MNNNCDKQYIISCCTEPVLGPIQNYYTKSQIDRMMSGITVSGVTVEELNAAIESAKTEIEAEIPTVPTQVSAFENDVPYLTEHQSLSAYSTTQEMNEAIASAKTEVESEIPSLEGYATTAYVESEISAQTGDFVDGEELSSYTYDKTTIDSKIASGGTNEPYGGYFYLEEFTGDPYSVVSVETPFYTYGNSQFLDFEYQINGMMDFGSFELNYETHTATSWSQSVSDNFDVSWEEKYQQFKVTPKQSNITVNRVYGQYAYPVDLIPSGSTNDTFDNVITYVKENDDSINSKFGDYALKAYVDNTFLKKDDSGVVTITQNDYVAGNNLCGNSGKLVRIQNGYERYRYSAPQFNSQTIAYNWYNGVSKDSLVLCALDSFVKVVENNQTYYPFDLTKQEIVNGGLEGSPVYLFTKTGTDSLIPSNSIFFKAESTYITLEDDYINFDINGKIYFDEACTKEYRSNPSWSMSGSATKTDGTWTGNNFYFSAPQLESDGFFSRTDSSKMGKIYDENGNASNIRMYLYAYKPSSTGKAMRIGFIYCLRNTNGISGDYHLYACDSNCINTNKIKMAFNNEQYYSSEDGAIDYSLLQPLGFTYTVDSDSADNKGYGGARYIISGASGNVRMTINETQYKLAETLNGVVTYHDEPVEGVYTIEVLEDGSRKVILDDDVFSTHYEPFFYRDGWGGIIEYYYLHYTPKPSVTYSDIDYWNGKQDELVAGDNITISGNVISATGGGSGGGISSAQVQTMIDESVSGKANASDVYTKLEVNTLIMSAVTDVEAEIPTVPTNVSAFNNDAGYLTEHQSLSAYSTTTEVGIMIWAATSGKAETSALTEVDDVLSAHTSNSEIHVTTAQTASWDAKSDFSGSYTDLTNKPTIPVIWSGTQAAFDLISPKDPNTIYLVY